ncbi:hypothetical protein ES332_D09G138000v1 [Gossypium tomentosum]|uniref:non-specific serine/threonine protein kinase n=1 Tax=Gossypium tomentosum TaxID=34277 RepID=A0A5D2JGP0_GOSTO|nr:hypothetical protein ES332_D09G138000v1 [Gossypium tomentosum]
MGICSYSDTSPICGCRSENFRLLDVNDLRQGCKRKRNIEDCPGSAAMLELNHAESLTYPPELPSQTFFVGISACRLTCLVTASCVASTSLSDGTGLCYLRTTEFVSGYQFKEKLGARGFGAVYKGVLSSRAVVAVKQLEGIEQGEKQFRMEVATISSTHHLNLVRLIGFCAEGHHRLLVYEFMKNGSLDNFLFTTEEHSGKMLSWEYRHNVALGTTGGIMYLHEECRDCIIHCDIKPENTLLDEIFNAKMSDFGLAKVINAKDNRYRILTSVREARSYLVPEWLANLPITSKSDVIAMGWYCLR